MSPGLFSLSVQPLCFLSRGPIGGLISQHRIALLGSLSQDAKGRPKVRACRPGAVAGGARYGVA